MNANSLARRWKAHRASSNDRTCHDCGKLHPAMFMLRDEVWDAIAVGSADLCFGCAEKRLGRPIVFEDLRPCMISDDMLIGAYLAKRSDITFDDNFLETV